MNRSRKYVFVPFCMLSQGIRATSIVKVFPAIVNPVVELFMQKNINIVQMPCPELVFDGFHRQPCGKSQYDNSENRKICRDVAQGIVNQMELFINNGCKICLVMGIDYSPSCAVSLISGKFPKNMKRGRGIFIEELQYVMRCEGIDVPFVGTRIYRIDETIEAIKNYI